MESDVSSESVEFFVEARTNDTSREARIPEALYLEARRCHRAIKAYVVIETQFDMLMDNYVELETETLSHALKSGVFLRRSESEIRHQNSLVERRLLNFLATCQQYLDHTKSELARAKLGKKDEYLTFEENVSLEHKSNRDFRIVRALRNYVQHEGLAAGLRISYRRDDSQPDRKLVAVCSIPMLNPTVLIRDKNLTGDDREYLASATDGLDIRPLVRGFMESIGRIHLALRASRKPNLDNWDELSEKCLRLLSLSQWSDTGGYLYFTSQSEDRVVERIVFFPGMTDYREELERKNSLLGNFKDIFVTSLA